MIWRRATFGRSEVFDKRSLSPPLFLIDAFGARWLCPGPAGVGTGAVPRGDSPSIPASFGINTDSSPLNSRPQGAGERYVQAAYVVR